MAKKENVYHILRIVSNKTMSQLAKEMDTTPSYLGEIEKGKREVSKDFLARYSRALGVKESTIMHFTEENEAKNLSYPELMLLILETLVGEEDHNAEAEVL